MTPFTFSTPPRVGIHSWLFGQVRIAQLKGYPADYIRETFRPALDSMLKSGALRREVSDRDLDQAIGNIFATVDRPAREPAPLVYHPVNGWGRDATTLKAVIDQQLVDRALSEPANPPAPRGHWYDLYSPDDILCIGESASRYCAISAKQLPDHADAQFLVPNPLRKRLGRTKSGRLTSHCRDAVGPRRFIVMENDHGFSAADQVHILHWFSAKTETPLRLIVSSGSKSVHGWFDTRGADEQTVFSWTKLAVRVGFDPRLYLPEQLVRLPNGFRPDKNARQEILYTHT